MTENEIIDLNDAYTFFGEIEDIKKEREESTIGIQATDPNIDYAKQLQEKYKGFVHDGKIDDSFVEDEDKIKLIEAVKYIVETEYKVYPSPMNQILIEKMYYNCIKNMNKEDYLKEKEDLKSKSILEIELSKLDKFSGL